MVNYLTLGYDCSTATALRDLKLRNYALPFDWVVSSKDSLSNCIKDDFKNYHKELSFHPSSKTRLVDSYGFEFPHDYPTINSQYSEERDEYGEDVIVDNWSDFHLEVLQKYSRRIERFREIVNSKKPLIVLYRGSYNDAIFLKSLLISNYNIQIVKFVVASKDVNLGDIDIFMCNPEIDGKWNDIEIWSKSIDLAIQNI